MSRQDGLDILPFIPASWQPDAGRGDAMDIKVGTFNLNNLFSRFNFKAHVDELPQDQRDVTITYEFNDEGDYWFRTFRGRLIQPMAEEQRLALAARIKAMDLDVLAVQGRGHRGSE